MSVSILCLSTNCAYPHTAAHVLQIEKLEDVADTLEELWISYNLIASLDGLQGCSNLTTLYVSNNMIKSWAELDKLVSSLLMLYLMCCS